MAATEVVTRRAPARAVPRKRTSGPSRPNVLTGPGRDRCSCRSAGRSLRSTRACTVAATVARYYDPATAQFLTRDPLEDETGQPYSYAGDDPLDESDPSGLCGHWYDVACQASNAAYDALTTGPGKDISGFLEGTGNFVTAGGTEQIANLISPGATCTEDQSSWFYRGGEIFGGVGLTVLGGASVYYGGTALISTDTVEASRLATLSGRLGLAASGRDVAECVNGNHAACVAAVLGVGGGVGSGVSGLDSLSTTAAGLLGALSGASGASGTAVDVILEIFDR